MTIRRFGAALAGVVLALACVPLGGCADAQKQAQTQAFIDQTKADVASMKVQVQAANDQARVAFNNAIDAKDRASALKQVELTDKQLAAINKVSAAADVASNAVRAVGGDTTAGQAVAQTAAGALAATPLGPWAPLVGLGISGIINVIQLRKQQQAQNDAAAALSAQAAIASHALTPGATPADVQANANTVLSGLSEGAKALYNATPDIPTPNGAV